jgi:hypothetical protein
LQEATIEDDNVGGGGIKYFHQALYFKGGNLWEMGNTDKNFNNSNYSPTLIIKIYE